MIRSLRNIVPGFGMLVAVVAAILIGSPGVAAASWGHIDSTSMWSKSADGDGFVQTVTGTMDWWTKVGIDFACPVGVLRSIDRTDTTRLIWVSGPLGRRSGQFKLINSAPFERDFRIDLHCR